jgi:hypothetical protein
MSSRMRKFVAAAMTSAFAPAIAWSQAAAPQPAAPAASQPANPAAVLQGAERIGAGRFTAYRKGASTLVVLPPGSVGKPLLWYTEVVRVPAGATTSRGLQVGSRLARFERVGNVVHVRDLSTTQQRRAGAAPGEAPVPADGSTGVPGAAPTDPKVRPIDVALSSSETGALIASFPIVGSLPDGGLVVDVTATFSNDVAAATGRTVLGTVGAVPAAVDPSKSYIDSVRVRGDALTVRSHITFLSALRADPGAGPQPVSVVLGHSIVFLPEKPMAGPAGRPAHRLLPERLHRVRGRARHGTGHPVGDRALPARKGQPGRSVSDPVKPITYYLGRGMPERWKPYLTAGVLQWLPAFEAAGFSATRSACWTRPRRSRTRTGRPRT